MGGLINGGGGGGVISDELFKRTNKNLSQRRDKTHLKKIKANIPFIGRHNKRITSFQKHL